MAGLADDILEKILIGLDAKDLIRLKGVCKSWHSFISSPRFVKSHLIHTCNTDRTDNELGHRRIVCSVFGKHLVGSSNGLVCISPFYAKFVVANPMTLELRKLQNPHIPENSSLCWGFGYDLLTDDYKVILGYKKSENQTCFQVLTLKSDVWKVIGDVNYSLISNAGMLCNGALHWFMSDQNENKVVIISFDLSREEFKEIPQPDDMRYEFTSDTSLGMVDNCLCICGRRLSHRRWVMPNYNAWVPPNYNAWVMTNYNVRQSWTFLHYDNSMIMKYDAVHFLGHIPPRFFFCKDNIYWSRNGDYISAPLYVKSLVSPHVNGRRKKKWSVKVGSNYHVISWSFLVPLSIPKRKRCAKNRKRNAKLIKRDTSAPRLSAKV